MDTMNLLVGEFDKWMEMVTCSKESEEDRRGTKQEMQPSCDIRRRHRMNMQCVEEQRKKFAAAGEPFNPGNISSNTAYPSKSPFATLSRTSIADLCLEMATKGVYVLLRLIEPGCTLTGFHTVVEDDQGNVCIFSVYNYPSRELFSVGTVLILKEPYFKIAIDGLNTITCDCPTDIIVLGRSHSLYHLAKDVKWRNQLCENAEDPLMKCPVPVLPEEWKERGNALYKSGNLVLAQEAYQLGLQLCNEQNLIWKLLTLNTTAIYLILGYFEKTIAAAAIVLQKFPGEKKALLRAGKAYYNLRKYRDALKVLKDFHQRYPNDSEGQMELYKIKLRLKEQKTGCIDVERLKAESKADPLKKLDCADYIGPVKIVKMPGKRRGVVLTKNVAKGTLLIASKAFAASLDPVRQQLGLQFHSNMLMYTQDQVDVVSKVAEAVAKNPNTFGPIIYDLPTGIEPRKGVAVFCDPESKQEPIADVELIRDICNSSSFIIGDADANASMHLGGCGTGLFILPSYINHCCVYNVHCEFYNDVMLIYANQKIKAGKEIFICYIPSTEPYEEHKQMGSQRNSTCNCLLCHFKN